MNRLFLVRHAWAEPRDGALYPVDDLRPLTDEGRTRFKKMVRRLSDRGFAPDLVATSPLLRARQTAEIVCTELDHRPHIENRGELAPGGSLEDLLAWSLGFEGSMAWVGHAPDISGICGLLIAGGGASIEFSKGAVACLDFPERIAMGQGQLRWLVTAKVVGA